MRKNLGRGEKGNTVMESITLEGALGNKTKFGGVRRKERRGSLFITIATSDVR